jgi:caffeoyl-CoA O-methyltransferase
MINRRLKLVKHRLDAVLFLACAMLIFSPAPAGAQQANNPLALALERLAWMSKNQLGMLNVSASEGAFLRDQVIAAKAKRALEIGTSNGYSTIWIALGLRQTNGRLTTLEIDATKVALARENFRAAGVESLITLQQCDALEEIPKLSGPFEFVFIDAWKRDYVRYLDMVLPLVPPGGVIVAHNITNQRAELQDFIDRVKSDPRLKTTIANPGPGGFSVSVKQPDR